MNREQKKQRRRERRLLAKQREIENQDLDAEEDIEGNPAVIETGSDPDPIGQQIEKDFYPLTASDVSGAEPGPTSFSELDEMRKAEETAEAVREVTWDVQDIVRNILHSPELDAVEKSDAMKAAADEFASRVDTAIEEEVSKSADLDLLQLEAIIANDQRNTPYGEVVTDILKEVVSYASRKNMPDSNFALVTTRNGKKVRKYLIHDKSHVRNALARAAQQIKRGGEGAADARAALPKIHAAAKRMGIGSNMEKDRRAILIEKGADGKFRWIGWASNNFQDWDGDIISKEAHQEYVDWLDKNMDVAPVFDTWHIPGTARQHPVDFAMFEKGFLILSGPLEENEAAGLFRAQKETDLGMSIAAFGYGRDPKDPRVITKYRMYAVTDLPLDKAANPFTDFETVVKEVGMDKLKYLTEIMGEEKATAFLAKTEQKQKALQEAGVESKEKKDEVPAEPATEPAPVMTVVNNAPVAPQVDEIVAKLVKEMDLPGLSAFVTEAKEAMSKVEVLESLVKDLQGTKDEDLAKALTPPAARFAWSKENRPSMQDGNVLDETKEDKELKKSVPGVPEGYWLSEVTGTAPLKAE